MENKNQQNYGNINQYLGDEVISYPQQLPLEQGEYGQDGQDQMEKIYAEKIESVKETTKHQIKYFEPIEISSEEDVAKYLLSGQLILTIASKINDLKKKHKQKETVTHQYILKSNLNLYKMQQSTITKKGTMKITKNKNQLKIII